MGRYYNDFNDVRDSDDELMHYGVQGMKWGIRKYVNYDGSLTAEGRRKYGSYQNFAKSSEGRKMLSEAKNQNGVKTRQSSQEPKKGLSTKRKIEIGKAVAGSILAAGGGAYAFKLLSDDVGTKNALRISLQSLAIGGGYAGGYVGTKKLLSNMKNKQNNKQNNKLASNRRHA